MHDEDRLVHFSTELLHAPQRHDLTALKKLYFELSQSASTSYDSSDFSQPVQPKMFSKRGTKTHSALVFLPDRLVILEEWADSTLLAYMERVEAVAREILRSLPIGAFLAEVVTLRGACTVTHSATARDFVLEKFCHQDGAAMAESFGRRADVGAIRLLFGETPESPGTYHVSIEPFRNAPREVLVEVKGVFRSPAVDAEGVGLLPDRIREVRSFLSQRVYPYLNRFDVP